MSQPIVTVRVRTIANPRANEEMVRSSGAAWTRKIAETWARTADLAPGSVVQILGGPKEERVLALAVEVPQEPLSRQVTRFERPEPVASAIAGEG